MMKFKDKNKKGFTLIEMVFYVTIFAIFSLVAINTLILMVKSFRESQVQSDIIQSSQIMERIVREIRNGESITISANSLKLRVGEDGTLVGDTVEFVLSSGNVLFYGNDDVLVGNLNSPSIIVNNLTFTEITTTQGIAVKVYLSLTSRKDNTNKTYDFYDTAVLRDSY